MSNGSDTVLKEMKKMKISLTKDDLIADILDEKAKIYLLKYYQSLE